MAKTYSAVLVGVDVHLVEIESVLGTGFSGLNILGLPMDVAKDMRERVRSALESVGIPIPARRVVVNVSPAESVKMARSSLSELDFAVAASIVISLEQASLLTRPLEFELSSGTSNDSPFMVFGGELSLSGELRPLKCSLVFEALKSRLGKVNAQFFLPNSHQNLEESLPGSQHFALLSDWFASPVPAQNSVTLENPAREIQKLNSQLEKRREQLRFFLQKMSDNPRLAMAMLVAAAGKHHILLAGEPGVGKSFALSHLPLLLPPLTAEESTELQLVSESHLSTERPVRTPHHSTTAAALLGGASLRPGEVTLAHRGVLFLDELAEFPRNALESLREPLDHHKVALSRTGGKINYPADILVCAATNPCPCGFLFSKRKPCRCSLMSRRKYVQKLSGPLLDRFAVQVWVSPPGEDSFEATLMEKLKDERCFEMFFEKFCALQEQSWFQRELTLEASSLQCGVDLEVAGLSKRGEQNLRAVSRTLRELFPELSCDPDLHSKASTFRELERMFFHPLIS